MRAFDSFLIDKIFEPLCGLLADYAEKSPHWLAVKLMYGQLAFGIVFGFLRLHELFLESRYGWAAFDIVLYAFFILFTYGFIRESERLDRKSQSTSVARNPVRFRDITLRMIIVLICCLDMWFGLDFRDVDEFLFFFALYFRACDGRPPRVRHRRAAFAGGAA